MAEEATVNPDGSTTFEGAGGEEAYNATSGGEEDTIFVEEEIVKGLDPAIYLGLFVVVVAVLWFFVLRSKNKEEDEFFAELDVEKVRLLVHDNACVPSVDGKEKHSLTTISVKSIFCRIAIVCLCPVLSYSSLNDSSTSSYRTRWKNII